MASGTILSPNDLGKVDYSYYGGLGTSTDTQVATYLLNNIPTGRVICGLTDSTNGTIYFIGHVYDGRLYGSVLLLEVTASSSIKYMVRRNGSDSFKVISGS